MIELTAKHRQMPELTLQRLRVSRDMWNDCLNAAHVALWTAAQRFDPTRGAQFTTYAWWRVTGAVLDVLKAERRPEITEQHAREAHSEPIEVDPSAASDVERILSKLCAADELLLRNHFLEGHDMTEIARAIGCDKSWISRRIARALERAREVAF